MTTADRAQDAIRAIDHGFLEHDRSASDWCTLAIVHGLIAVAEAIDRAVTELDFIGNEISHK